MNISQKNRVFAFLIFVVAFATYWQVLSAGFLNWDDDAYVFANSMVPKGISWDGIVWSFSTFNVGNWHPLTMLSLMVDAHLFGLNPFGFHFTNIVLHAANSALVFYFAARILGSIGGALTVALIFAVHPQHVESVAWISERKGLLSTSAWLLALLAWQSWMMSRTTSGPSGHKRFFWFTVALHGVSLLAKPVAVALPLTLLILDWWSNQNRQAEHVQPTWLKLILEKWPFFLLSAVFSVVTIYAQDSAIEPSGALPWTEHVLRVFRNYGWYLWKSLVPYPLSPFYVAPPEGYLTIATAAYLLFFAGFFVIAWRIRRLEPGLLFGALWFFATLLPTIGVVKVGNTPTTDRYAYVPHIGLFIAFVCFGLFVVRRWPQLKRGVIIAATFFGLICAGLTIRQIPVWSNSESLWTWVIESGEQHYVPLRNLAQFHLESQNFEEAMEFSKRAIELHPAAKSPHIIIALCKIANGDLVGAEEKISHFRSLTGWANSVAGEVAEARGDFLTAVIAWEPAMSSSQSLTWDDHVKLASVYSGIGATEKSEEYIKRASELQPQWPQFMFVQIWSRLLDPIDGPKKAFFLLQQAKRLGRVSVSTDPQILQIQAAALANTGKFSEAIRMMDQAVSLIEGDPELWAALGPAFLEQRRGFSEGKPLYALTGGNGQK
jgi:tetratricopeptide (TPR) repeat protein